MPLIIEAFLIDSLGSAAAALLHNNSTSVTTSLFSIQLNFSTHSPELYLVIHLIMHSIFFIKIEMNVNSGRDASFSRNKYSVFFDGFQYSFPIC